MKFRFYIHLFYSLPLLFGCESKPQLNIQDLKFVNIDKIAISQNQIDTTYLISDFIGYTFNKIDSFGYNIYDEKGNLIKEWRYGFMGPPESVYLYDSNNLVIHKDYSTDFWARYDVSYKYVQDSFLLYQYWSDGAPLCLFYFDEKGLLINSIEHEHEDGGSAEAISDYEYDSQNKLIRKVEKLQSMTDEQLKLREEYYGKGINTHNITNYFYTGTKMDSLITTYYFQSSPKNNYTSRTYYDKHGLRTKTILKDSIITTYVHKVREF